MNHPAPDIAFLGVCRAQLALKGNPPATVGHHLMGLSTILRVPMLPFAMGHWSVVIAVFDAHSFVPATLELRSPSGRMACRVEARFAGHGTVEADYQPETNPDVQGVAVGSLGPGWLLAPVTMDWMLAEAGTYTVHLIRENEPEQDVGRLTIVYQRPSPLTAEQRLAMLADRNCIKAARMAVGCRRCPSTLTAVTTLDDQRPANLDGGFWYKELPDRFECSCGATKVDLGELPHSIQAVFSMQPGHAVDLQRLYTVDVIHQAVREFEHLLERPPENEEEVHQFLLSHPVLFCPFGARRLWSKTPILSEMKTDFAIHDARGDLWLVEIEHPKCGLMTQNGKVHADTEHALDQVRSWLKVVAEERTAVLRAFGLASSDVNQVRGRVVVGRDRNCSSTLLSQLKWNNFGDVELMTYDDLVRSVTNVARTIAKPAFE